MQDQVFNNQEMMSGVFERYFDAGVQFLGKEIINKLFWTFLNLYFFK